MSKTKFRIHHAVVLAALLGAGCEAKGEYRVNWTFSDMEGEITSALDCSSRGVDRIEVTMVRQSDGTVNKTVHTCSAADTGTQSVEEGTYVVYVQAFGPSGAAFTDPATGEVALMETGGELVIKDDGQRAEVSVTFTPNPHCADGVDNDADGLVDAADPGCRDKNGEYDPAGTTEVNEDEPAPLQVTWSINGGEACADVQPTGAATVLVEVDDAVVGIYPCSDGTGQIPLTPGEHSVALRLVGGTDATGLATTPTQTATLIQSVLTELDFEFTLDTFLEPQTGELSFWLWWIAPGDTCTDASPVVAEQSLWLQDDAGVTVDATTWAGTSVDNTAAAVGQCIDASELQGLTEYIPAGSYTLTVTGYAPGGASCWEATFPDLIVGIGPNDLVELVVPQTDATGPCAP